jgi:hypothetical protein
MRCEACHRLGNLCNRCRAEVLADSLRQAEEALARQKESHLDTDRRLLKSDGRNDRLEERLRDAEKALGDVRDLGGVGTAAQIAGRYFEGIPR